MLQKCTLLLASRREAFNQQNNSWWHRDMHHKFVNMRKHKALGVGKKIDSMKQNSNVTTRVEHTPLRN